jgi:hypothetical protein
MPTYSKLNKRIMRRVYGVYLYHKLVNPISLKAYGLAIFAVILSVSVSFSHIIANMPALTNFSAWYQFNIAALSHSDFNVKVLLASLLMLALWLLRDLISNTVIESRALHHSSSYF